MSEHRMPDLPEGYRWVIEQHTGGGTHYGVVKLEKFHDRYGWQHYHLELFRESWSPKTNAKRAVAKAQKLVSEYITPPPPRTIDVNGLTGAVLGEGVVGNGSAL